MFGTLAQVRQDQERKPGMDANGGEGAQQRAPIGPAAPHMSGMALGLLSRLLNTLSMMYEVWTQCELTQI